MPTFHLYGTRQVSMMQKGVAEIEAATEAEAWERAEDPTADFWDWETIDSDNVEFDDFEVVSVTLDDIDDGEEPTDD